jgi:hypothetical protein
VNHPFPLTTSQAGAVLDTPRWWVHRAITQMGLVLRRAGTCYLIPDRQTLDAIRQHLDERRKRTLYVQANRVRDRRGRYRKCKKVAAHA